MKKLSFLSAIAGLFSIFFLAGCTREYSVTPAGGHDGFWEPEIEEYRNLSEAVREALDFAGELDGLTRSAGRTVGKVFTVGEPSAVRSRNSEGEPEGDPLIYFINFEDDQGFAIVAGDREAPAILALTEEGHIDPDQEIDNPGLAIFLEMAEDYLNGIAAAGGIPPLNPPTPIKPFDPNDPFPTLPGNGTRTEYGSWTVYEKYGTILPCRWGQRNPYNMYCPLVMGQEPPAGCVAVAMAQIMYYYSYPSSHGGYTFNWTEMRKHTGLVNYPAAHNMIARLMQQLGNGHNLMMLYNTNNSTSKPERVAIAFRNFGYQSYSGNLSPYLWSTIRSELMAGRPIICSGQDIKGKSGHAWVIDQTYIRSRQIRQYDRKTGYMTHSYHEYQNYVHCNMGWAGSFDGYYLDKVFDINNIPFTRSDTEGYIRHNLKLYINIRR